MFYILSLLLTAHAARAIAVTGEAMRLIVREMIVARPELRFENHDILRSSYDHTPEFWGGVLNAIVDDQRPYGMNDLRADLLGDLRDEAREPRLRASPNWRTHAVLLRAPIFEMLERYGRKHKQRFVLIDIMNDLELWTDEQGEYLTRVLHRYDYGILAYPWLRLMRDRAPATTAALETVLNDQKFKPSFTARAAAYRAGLVVTTPAINRLILAYGADATEADLRSMRKTFRAHRATSVAGGELYRTEANLLLRGTFEHLRRRYRAKDPVVVSAFNLAEIKPSGYVRWTMAHQAKLVELIGWLRSKDSAEKIFDVANVPCEGPLSSADPALTNL